MLINTKQAAELLGYHEQSIRDLVYLRKLPATKVGRNWFFDRTELLELKKQAEQINSTVSKVYLTKKLLAKARG